MQGMRTDLPVDVNVDAALNATSRGTYDSLVARHFYFNLSFPSTFNKSLYGDPAFAAINLTVTPAGTKTALTYDLQFFGKPPLEWQKRSG